MRYFYEESKINTPIFGKVYANENSLYRSSTLYFEKGRGLCVVRLRFDENSKSFYFSHLEYSLANNIYLSDGFKEYFNSHARKYPYPVVNVRKIMWALRMKPLRKEFYEEIDIL